MGLLKDIWAGYQRLPVWVQFWLACVLVPANFASVLFAGEPGGGIVAALAIGGIAPNAVIMVVTRRFGREMAVAHLILWPPLVMVIIWLLASEPAPAFARYLWILLVVDAISIAFDIRDGRILWNARYGQEKTRR